MADSTTPPPSTPTPAPDANPKKKRQAPSPIDQRFATDLASDKVIIDAAQAALADDPALATDLAGHFLDTAQTIAITPASLAELSQQADAAKNAGAAIVAAASAAQGVTGDEKAKAKKAVAAIRAIQSAAKEKYEETNATKLAAYYVGQPVDTRPEIEQAATACWAQVGNIDEAGNPITPADTLPGITAKLPQLHADLGDYVTVQLAQQGAKQTATDARTAYEDQCNQISRRRRRLQQAFDTERPYRRENATLRRSVGLPTDKGLS